MSFPRSFPLNAVVKMATVSTPSKGIYLLSMHNTHSGAMDNRLTPDFIKTALLPALDEIELQFRKDHAAGDTEASLVITGERVKNKFFSNGLDLSLVVQCPGFFKDYYYTLMERIITFPMHTVSAINGHCFAGGFALAQCTDHRIIRHERAWCCMNELDFGAPLPEGMHAVLKHRLPAQTLRKVMFSAHRFTAPEALAAGIVDEIVEGDGEAVIARALVIAKENAKHSTSGVLQMIKQTICADAIAGLQLEDAMRSPGEQNEARFAALKAAVASAQAKL